MKTEIGVVATDRAPRAIGPYSQAVSWGGVVYLSGQIGLDPASGELVGETVAQQASRALENVGAVLEAAGSGFDRVLKTTVFLTDMNDFAEMNAVYGRYFGGSRPARATVQVSGLPKGARVEIDAIALLGR